MEDKSSNMMTQMVSSEKMTTAVKNKHAEEIYEGGARVSVINKAYSSNQN